MAGLQDTGPATEQQTLFRDMESGKPTSPLMISLGYVFIRVIRVLNRIPGRLPARFSNKPVFNTYTVHRRSDKAAAAN